MVAKNAGRSGRNWRKVVEQAKRELPPVCWICRNPINRALDKNDAMSWTLDHDPPRKLLLELGLDPEDPRYLKPAHRRCNSRKGTGEAPIPPKASRHWG
jgi:hypothetical protein